MVKVKVPFAVAVVLSTLDLSLTAYALFFRIGFIELHGYYALIPSAVVVLPVFILTDKLHVPRFIRFSVYIGLLAVLVYPVINNLILLFT